MRTSHEVPEQQTILCMFNQETRLHGISAQQKGIAMRPTKLLTFLVAFAFTLACAYGQDVHYNYDRGTNFASYKTYQWVEASSAAPKADLPGDPPKFDLPGGAPFGDVRGRVSDDQLIRRDIERAVDEQLAQKGLNKVEKNGDLVVTYHVGVREEKSVSLFGSGWKAGGTGWWDGSVQGQSSTIPIGTLVVDVYDSARKQLIWRGYASKTIDLKKDPDKNYKNLQRAMAKLFKNYPPQTVK